MDSANPLIESERRDALAVSARAIASLRSDYRLGPRFGDCAALVSESSSIESMRADLSRVLSQYFLKKYTMYFALRNLIGATALSPRCVAARGNDSKLSQINGLRNFNFRRACARRCRGRQATAPASPQRGAASLRRARAVALPAPATIGTRSSAGRRLADSWRRVRARNQPRNRSRRRRGG